MLRRKVKAVIPPGPDDKKASSFEALRGGDKPTTETAIIPEEEKAKAIIVYPWVKPQIVTYSSHFVDKLSFATCKSY